MGISWFTISVHRKLRNRCKATTSEYVEILEFTHFVRLFTFGTVDEKYREKSLVDRITVVVGLKIESGNTKILFEG